MKKRSSRSRKRRKPISQYTSDKPTCDSTEKAFTDPKEHSGEVIRGIAPQVGGGEGEKEKWWKAITVSKRNTPQSTTTNESDTDTN